MDALKKIKPLLLIAFAITLAIFATVQVFRFFNRANLEKALNGRDGFSVLFLVTSAATTKRFR
jgi:hypothetical protein